jgi:hypothetical protein
MTRKEGRWPAFADARGIDAKYAQVRRQAEQELADTEAGPRNTVSVPAEDTDMKNPHGEFQHPSPMTGTPAHHAKAEEMTDLQGEQGAAGIGRK